MAAFLSIFALVDGNARAGQGTELAKEMLQRIRNATAKQDVNALLQEATQKKSRLSAEDRIDYAEYLEYVIASDTAKEGEGRASWAAAVLIPGGINEQEDRDACARLLSSNDPAVRDRAESLAPAGDVKLANGERGQDMSLFDLALHDPKVPKDQLIGAMFKLAPVESAQWIADHGGVSAGERNGLESDLHQAWKIHRALNDPNADKETKAVLDDSVKNALLGRWLHSPSWILRSMANGLLTKREELQTPDLKKAMQPMQIPAGLQISSTEARAGSN